MAPHTRALIRARSECRRHRRHTNEQLHYRDKPNTEPESEWNHAVCARARSFATRCRRDGVDGEKVANALTARERCVCVQSHARARCRSGWCVLAAGKLGASRRSNALRMSALSFLVRCSVFGQVRCSSSESPLRCRRAFDEPRYMLAPPTEAL